MANLSVRKLDNTAYEQLRIRAAKHGVSMEEEARQIIYQVVLGSVSPSQVFRKYFGSEQGIDLTHLPRGEPHEPMEFDMTNTTLPIGVFDSGMGGLTVLRALKNQLPQESFIYFGDTARLPYGTKSPETVKQYAIQMTKILMERRIKALVIACNTATTAALPHLEAMFPDIPVIGVVRPGAKAVIEVTSNQRIMIFATETTIASQVYQQFILEQLPEALIESRSCSLLVALAEEGMTVNAIATEVFRHYLSEFSDQDTLLLGCTHFPVFKPLLQRLLPQHVTIVDSAEATAKALHATLVETKLLNKQSASAGLCHYLVTDSAARFETVGSLFLGESIPEAAIEVVDGVTRR